MGIIGLGPEGHGLKQFLAQMGVARILGIDADFRQLTRFEKRDGIASSIDHVYDNADFLLITPGYKTRLDEKRLHPGQIILSFSPGVVDESSLEQTIAERIYQGPDPHPIFIMPGLIGAIRQSRIQRINIDHLYRLMSTLTGRASEYSFLPAPSTELFKAQFQALGAGPRAQALALHVLAWSQGVAVMATAFRDPEFVAREVAGIEGWLATQTFPPSDKDAPCSSPS